MLADKLLAAPSGGVATPTFVSESTVEAGGGTLTIAAPAGIVDGDLLIIITSIADSATYPLVSPTGFEVVYTGYSPLFGSNSHIVLSKVASGESGSYTFQWGNNRDCVAQMLVYRNATRINTVGVMSNVISPTTTAASIAPTHEGTLVFVSNTQVSTTVSTPPAGMTLVSGITGTSYSGAIYELEGQTASATGSKSLVWSITSAAVGLLLQVTNETADIAPELVATAEQTNTVNSLTVVVSKPTGTVAGDTMVAFITNSTNNTWTLPSGWTSIGERAGSMSALVAYKVAGASEPTDYTFTNDSAKITSGLIVTYRYGAYESCVAPDNTTVRTATHAIAQNPTMSQSLNVCFVVDSNSSVVIAPNLVGFEIVNQNSDGNRPSWVLTHQSVPAGLNGSGQYYSSSAALYKMGVVLTPTRSM